MTVSKSRKAAPGGQEKPNLTSASHPRVRMEPQEREKQIVAKAIEYFAEHGFGGGIRDLAHSLDITSAALYRYFPSKDALIERVYQEVFLARWNPLWEIWLTDRSVPLRERLVRHYQDYARTIMASDWIRIFLHAGLAKIGFNDRYYAMTRDRIGKVVIQEIRHAYGITEQTDKLADEIEIELLWGLHSSIFNLGIRRWVYGVPVRPEVVEPLITLQVDSFLDGAPAVMKGMTGNQPKLRRGRQPKAAR